MQKTLLLFLTLAVSTGFLNACEEVDEGDIISSHDFYRPDGIRTRTTTRRLKDGNETCKTELFNALTKVTFTSKKLGDRACTPTGFIEIEGTDGYKEKRKINPKDSHVALFSIAEVIIKKDGPMRIFAGTFVNNVLETALLKVAGYLLAEKRVKERLSTLALAHENAKAGTPPCVKSRRPSTESVGTDSGGDSPGGSFKKRPRISPQASFITGEGVNVKSNETITNITQV